MRSFALIFCLVAVECSQPTRVENTKREFDRYYAQWQKECEQPNVRIMSNSKAYTSLPSYRAIVALGRPALPYLKDKMEHDSGFDFMLVYAAIEIEGWDASSFGKGTGAVQGLRDKVLARMRAEQ